MYHYDENFQWIYDISIKVQNNLEWSSRIFAKFINGGAQDMPDVFSTNVFASSFKIAAACFRMTKFYAG